jgi:hypothetical protein
VLSVIIACEDLYAAVPSITWASPSWSQAKVSSLFGGVENTNS